MKVRFFPKTEAVRNVLVGRINDTQAALEEVAKSINDVELPYAIVLPGQTEMLKSSHLAHTADLNDLKSQLSLLESHGPPEVMCEIDL